MAEVLKLGRRVVARPCQAVPFQHMLRHFFLVNVKFAEWSTLLTGSCGELAQDHSKRSFEGKSKKMSQNFIKTLYFCQKFVINQQSFFMINSILFFIHLNSDTAYRKGPLCQKPKVLS